MGTDVPSAGVSISQVAGSQHLVCLQGCVQTPEYPSRFGLDRDGVSVLAERLEAEPDFRDRKGRVVILRE